MPTLGQLGTGTQSQQPIFNQRYLNPAQQAKQNAFDQRQTQWRSDLAANGGVNPNLTRGMTATQGMSNAQKYLYAIQNRLDPRQLGMDAGAVNFYEQGLHGVTMNPTTGQITGQNGQPVDPSQLNSMANTNMGRDPNAPMTPGQQGDMTNVAGGVANPFLNSANPLHDAPQYSAGGAAAGAGGTMGTGIAGAAAGGSLTGGLGAGAPPQAGNGSNTTLGALGVGKPLGVPSVTEAPGNYTGGMDMSSYLNPEAGFARDEGLKALQGSYAGAGTFLSGPAMKGISDYTTKSAINSAWQPAFQNYMQDKGFNYGVDTGDRNFAYQTALNDQTIPFDQQIKLGTLGLQGTNSNAQLMTSLAALLSNNMLSGANAGAAGTIGGSNALTQAISQMIANGSSNRLMNNLNLGG